MMGFVVCVFVVWFVLNVWCYKTDGANVLCGEKQKSRARRLARLKALLAFLDGLVAYFINEAIYSLITKRGQPRARDEM